MTNKSKNNKTRHAKAMGANKPDKQEYNKEEARPISKQKTTNTKTETKTQTRKFETSSYVDNENMQNQSNKLKQQTLSSSMSKKRKTITALIIIGGTLLIGIAATLIGGKMREGYIKPPAYPPDWLFPVVWTILYIMIGISAYLAFISSRDKKKRKTDMIWYGIHLFFNFLWPLFYFRLDLLIFSCIWLLFNVITAIIVTYKFYKARMCSGIMFTIYTLWLLFALYLSLGTTMLNIMG